MINLGDIVKDTITDFQGTVVGITEWLNGCRRIGIQSPKLKDGIPVDPQWIDESQLILISKRKKQESKQESKIKFDSGGPISLPQRQKDPIY